MSDAAYPYRWVILFLGWSAYVTVFLSRLSIGPLAPFLKESLTLSNTEIGGLVTASTILYSPMQIISGWLADRLGVRPLLIGGIFVASLCTTAMFLAPSYLSLLVLLALAGAGNGCIMPSGTKAIIAWFPPRERATALGINQSATNFGGIVAAAMLPTVALTIGWRYGFVFIGSASLALCAGVWFLYRDPPEERTFQMKQSNRKTLILLKSRDAWMLSLCCMTLAVIEFSAMAYLVLYLNESLLFDVVAAGGILALAQTSGFFGKPISGLVSDRLLGGRRNIKKLSCALLSTVGCLFFGLAGGSLHWFLYPLIIVFGIAAIGWAGMMATMAGELGGKDTAGAMTGTVSGLTTLGITFGPLIFGMIVDRTGGFREAWLAMAGFGILSLVFGALIREKRSVS